MKLFDYPEAKQVIVSGDIHGDFRTLVYKLCIQYGCTDTLLIVAGDCGFGFDKPILLDLYAANVYAADVYKEKSLKVGIRIHCSTERLVFRGYSGAAYRKTAV